MKKKNNKKSSKASSGKGSSGGGTNGGKGGSKGGDTKNSGTGSGSSGKGGSKGGGGSSSNGSSGGGKGKGGSKGGGSSVNGGGSSSTGSGKSPRSKGDTSGSRSGDDDDDDDGKKSKTKTKTKSKSSPGSGNKVRIHWQYSMSDIVWRFSMTYTSRACFFSPSNTHRKIPRTTRIPRNRTTPATTRTNLRPAPMTEKRVPIRTVKSLIPAKEDPSRAAMEIVAPDLAKEEKVVDPSLMETALLRQAKVVRREGPRPEIMARVVLESSEWCLVFIMFVACWSG